MAATNIDQSSFHRHSIGNAESTKFLREALALLGEAPDKSVLRYQYQRARAHSRLGYQLNDIGQFKEAKEHLQAALRIQKKLVDEDPANATYLRDLATTHHHLNSRANFRRAVAIYKRLLEDDPKAPAYRYGLVLALNRLGQRLRNAGQREEAKQVLKRRVMILEKLVDQFPKAPAYGKSLADAYLVLGTMQDRPENEQMFRRSLEYAEKVLVEFPEFLHGKRGFAEAAMLVAAVHDSQGELDEALALYERGMKALREYFKVDPKALNPRRWFIQLQVSSASILARQGKHQQAQQAYVEAVSVADQLAIDAPESSLADRSYYARADYIRYLLTRRDGRKEAVEQFRRLREREPSRAEDKRNYSAVVSEISAELRQWEQAIPLSPPSPRYRRSGRRLDRRTRIDR